MTWLRRSLQEAGFSLIELLVAMLILIPIMGAAMSIFSLGVRQHSSEQSSVEANQEARAALDLMTMEIAQAGSHRDYSTVSTSSVSPGSTMLSVASATGFCVGDFVDVDTGSNLETVQVTAVSNNSISANFRQSHDSGVPVRLFAFPFLNGVLPPAGLGANSSASVTTIRFFGDLHGDGNLQYVEYTYDSDNNQITRSMTPVAQSSKNPALPLVRNLKPGSVEFRLYTDNLGIVTSVSIKMTVRNIVKTGNGYEETALSSRVLIPSAAAASALLYDVRRYGGIEKFPSTPTQVTEWAGSYGQ